MPIHNNFFLNLIMTPNFYFLSFFVSLQAIHQNSNITSILLFFEKSIKLVDKGARHYGFLFNKIE